MELTILMPCLNEEQTIGVCIEKARSFLDNNDIDGEILIADNGSTDSSKAIANNLGARVISVAEKGYGSALISGCCQANGRYVIMGDSDDSYDFLNLMPFVEKLRDGYDLVMGNRFKGGIEDGAMPFLHKYLGNPLLSFIGRVLYHNKIGDWHCGLRGYNRESIMNLNLHTTGMEYASEMVVQATLHKLKMCEVPTTLSKDGRNKPPHLNTWSDGWRHLTFLLMHSPNWLFLYPGILLFLIGAIIGVCIELSPLSVKGIRFDINTLLYMGLLVIIGLQLILYAILTKKYAYMTKFIPISKNDENIIQFTMNNGIFLGLLLSLIGIIFTIIAISIWKSVDFGDLIPEIMLRITIPSIVLCVCGIEIIFASFFLGILEIKLRKDTK